MKKAFLLLATLALLVGCKQPTDDAPPNPPDTTLLINNLSDYNLLSVEYSGEEFGDINSGKEIEKKVNEGTKYIFFYLQTTNGRIRCRTNDVFIAEKDIKKPVGITNNTLVITTVSDRRDTLKNIVQTLNAEPANPEIEVSYNNYPVQSGDTVDLGDITLGSSNVISLVISNKGEHDLKLTGNAPQISGDNAAQVSAGNYTAQKMEYEDISSCTVTFTPTIGSVNHFTVKIINNDQDEGEYTVQFTARVKYTWQKLYGVSGQRYGIYRAISNGENGVYAGGYIGASSAAFFNFDQYGNLKNTFPMAANEGTLGPLDIGYAYNNFYSIIEYGNRYGIYQSASASAAPSFVAAPNLVVNSNPVYLYPRGIVRNAFDGYLYVGGNAQWTSNDSVYTLGITVDRHSLDGTWVRSNLLSPSIAGVTAETYQISGIELLNNGDILLYGYAARTSGVVVAFACAVRIDQANFSIRWQQIYPVTSGALKASMFRGSFWDGNDLILLGYCDDGGFAVKFSGSPADNAIPSGWPKVVAGVNGDWGSGQRVNDGSGYIFAGVAPGKNGGTDIWIVKTDANLVKQWDYFYGGAGDDYADAVVEVSDGFIIAGSTTSPNIGGINRAGPEDIYLLKVNKDGTLD